MKKILIDPKLNSYKANLHCHTTISDGEKTPEEIKKLYKNKGYSIVAYTDHEYLVDQSYLNDENFLALNGYEISICEQSEPFIFDYLKCYHFNFIAKNSKVIKQVGVDLEQIWPYKEELVNNIKYDEKYHKVYDLEKMNELIKKACENDYIVNYNHPNWSLHTRVDYIDLEGFTALEVYNNGCITGGYHDDMHVMDEMLNEGKKFNIVFTDDNHNRWPVESPFNDSFGGFVMIQSDELEYEKIINSLEKGNYYSSNGPIIDELYIEDNVLNIKMSDVVQVGIIGRGRIRTGMKKFDSFNEFSVKLGKEFNDYFYVVIIDKDGNKAVTNPYFNVLYY